MSEKKTSRRALSKKELFLFTALLLGKLVPMKLPPSLKLEPELVELVRLVASLYSN
jgi:hypothetical protein